MKKAFSFICMLLIIPSIILFGALLFGSKQSAWITLCVTALSCLPFFISFEKKETNTEKLILISVLVALSVVGRIVFTPLPGFKPVTAMVIIAALYFGSEVGFMTGALTAVISNFYFGQGPWTPFQMFGWGFIGLIAGLLASPLKKSKILLGIYALLSGVLFSLLLDVWTVLWADGYFNPSRYIATLVTTLPTTAVYAVSNLVFLIFLSKPIGRILNRIKTKYAIN